MPAGAKRANVRASWRQPALKTALCSIRAYGTTGDATPAPHYSAAPLQLGTTRCITILPCPFHDLALHFAVLIFIFTLPFSHCPIVCVAIQFCAAHFCCTSGQFIFSSFSICALPHLHCSTCLLPPGPAIPFTLDTGHSHTGCVAGKQAATQHTGGSAAGKTAPAIEHITEHNTL